MERKYSKVDYNGLLAIEMFEKLKYRINYNVVVDFINNGKREKVTEELLDVINFNKIVTSSGDIPFFEDDFAIVKITATQSGEILYINKILEHTNTPIDQTVLDFSRKKTYGDKIADKQLARKKKQMEANLDKEELNRQIKEIIVYTKDYVKEEKIDEWIEYVYRSFNTYESLQLLNITISTLKRINELDSFDNVDSFVLVDGLEASIITSAIIYFSKKGDEYLQNKLWGQEEKIEKKKTL